MDTAPTSWTLPTCHYSTFIWHFIVQSYSAMDGCTAINLWNTSKLIPSCCLRCMMVRELSQQSNNSCIRTALCTMTKLGQRQFWHAFKNYCWAAISDPIWTTKVPYERQINMLSSTDNKIFLFDFRSVSFFFILTLYVSCKPPMLHVCTLSSPSCMSFVYLRFIVILYQIYSLLLLV